MISKSMDSLVVEPLAVHKAYKASHGAYIV